VSEGILTRCVTNQRCGLDAILSQDTRGRVACETLLTTGLCVVAGEITTNAKSISARLLVRTIKKIGYDDTDKGFDYKTCGVVSL